MSSKDKDKDKKAKEARRKSGSHSGSSSRRSSSSRPETPSKTKTPEVPRAKEEKKPSKSKKSMVRSLSVADLPKCNSVPLPGRAPSPRSTQTLPAVPSVTTPAPAPSGARYQRSKSVLGLPRLAGSDDDLKIEKKGLDKEIEEKRAKSWDPQAEEDARAWIEDITGLKIGADFFGGLKNGVILCHLMNKIKPGIIPVFETQPQHWLQDKANVELFITACIKIRVPPQDQVTPLDMTERRKDPYQLLQAVYAISRQAQAMRCAHIPILGPKYYQTIQDQQNREIKKHQERVQEEKQRIVARDAQLKEFGYMQAKLPVLKVLVVGNIGTGKTSFIRRYVSAFFTKDYKSTIGVDFSVKPLLDVGGISGNNSQMQLWDIAGQERFSGMTRVFYKNAVGAFIVMDCSEMKSLNETKKWKEDIALKLDGDDVGFAIPVILLANKSDLVSEKDVSPTIDKFCKQNGFTCWFFTSAKTGKNVEEAGARLAKEIFLKLDEQDRKQFPNQKDKDGAFVLGETNRRKNHSSSGGNKRHHKKKSSRNKKSNNKGGSSSGSSSGSGSSDEEGGTCC